MTGPIRQGPLESDLEWREQIDRVPIRILYLRVALSPNRVPGFFDARAASLDHLAMDSIDIGGRLAQKGDCNSRITDRGRPLGSEGFDRDLGINEEAESTRKRRLGVPMSFRVGRVGELKAEFPVKRDRHIHVRHDHAYGVDPWHRLESSTRLWTVRRSSNALTIFRL